MAGFLYYIPGPTEGVSIVDVRAMGLGYAFESGSFAAPGVHANGLGENKQGVIVADPKRVERIGLYPDKQTWRRIPGRLKTQEAWVGFFNEDHPTPKDLARHAQHSGHWVTLNDGNDWLVLAVRQWAIQDGGLVWDYGVPQVVQLDDKGVWSPGPIKNCFEPIWKTACDWEDAKERAAMGEEDGDSPLVTFTGGLDAAVQALAVNYVVGPAECALLDLFTTPTAVAVLDALTDFPHRIELQKKIIAGLDGEPTSDGPEDSTPDTDQP